MIPAGARLDAIPIQAGRRHRPIFDFTATPLLLLQLAAAGAAASFAPSQDLMLITNSERAERFARHAVVPGQNWKCRGTGT